jgi:hypothetical protein
VDWIGQNPTWFWNKHHVAQVLKWVCRYWGNVLGLPDYVPPDLLVIRNAGVSHARREACRRRLAQLEHAPRSERSLLQGSSGTIKSSQERVLFAWVLKRAMLDYSLGVISPLQHEQRKALNAYWWVMSLPFIVPSPLAELTDSGWSHFERNKHRQYRLKNEDPFEGVGLQFATLVEMPSAERRYYPPQFPAQLEQMQRCCTFGKCCDLVGVEPNRARTWLHYVRPDNVTVNAD